MDEAENNWLLKTHQFLFERAVDLVFRFLVVVKANGFVMESRGMVLYAHPSKRERQLFHGQIELHPKRRTPLYIDFQIKFLGSVRSVMWLS